MVVLRTVVFCEFFLLLSLVISCQLQEGNLPSWLSGSSINFPLPSFPHFRRKKRSRGYCNISWVQFASGLLWKGEREKNPFYFPASRKRRREEGWQKCKNGFKAGFFFYQEKKKNESFFLSITSPPPPCLLEDPIHVVEESSWSHLGEPSKVATTLEGCISC